MNPSNADPASTPFAGLTPDTVLDALSAAGWQPDGRLLQLNSYENRVWQALLDDGRAVVVKFYRPGRWSDAQILEEHAFCAELARADLPVVAPLPLSPQDAALRLGGQDENTLGHFHDGDGHAHRFSVCDRRVGRAPELEDLDVLARLGRLIGRLHAVGARTSFVHRPPLSPAVMGWGARQRLLEGGFVSAQAQGGWLHASEQALGLVDAAFRQHPRLATLRLHGDCHPGNVLWRDEGEHAGPNFVDFDDCSTGPAVQDLWMLLPGEQEVVSAALHTVLEGYRHFMDFDDRELQLIEPLRTLRMIHHSAWIAARWHDPAFPIAFPWFASPAYWQQQTAELNEQIERMQSTG